MIYAKNGDITPIILGGGQEKGVRSGTIDTLSAVVIRKILEDIEKENEKILKLRKYLEKKLKESSLEYDINGEDCEKILPSVLSIYLKKLDTQSVITFLDVNGIYVSAGSACYSGNIVTSKVVEKLYGKEIAKNTIRVGIGSYNTCDEIDIFIQKLEELQKLKGKNNE